MTFAVLEEGRHLKMVPTSSEGVGSQRADFSFELMKKVNLSFRKPPFHSGHLAAIQTSILISHCLPTCTKINYGDMG